MYNLGDLFSVLAVENPELESELELLRHFGPDVPDEMLRQLVQAFSKLRSMADQGQLSYPYSTREVINVVKHMQVSFCFIQMLLGWKLSPVVFYD